MSYRLIVVLVIRADNSIALVRNPHGERRSWQLPGSSVRTGELPSDAARRTLEDEVGIQRSNVAITLRSKRTIEKTSYYVYEAYLRDTREYAIPSRGTFGHEIKLVLTAHLDAQLQPRDRQLLSLS